MSLSPSHGLTTEQLGETEEYITLLKRIQKLTQKLYTLDKELEEKNRKDISDRWQKALDISKILRDFKSRRRYSNRRQESLAKMFGYLGLVESLGATIVDIILLALAMNGKAVHTKGSHLRHAKTYSDIEGIFDFEYKMFLLKDEGLAY